MKKFPFAVGVGLGIVYFLLFMVTQITGLDTSCPATLVAGERYLLKLGERVCSETGSLILDNRSNSTVPITEDFQFWMMALEYADATNDKVHVIFEEQDAAHITGRKPDFYQHQAVFYPPKNEWANFWVWTAMYFQLVTIRYPQASWEDRLIHAESNAITIQSAMEGLTYEQYLERTKQFIAVSEKLYNYTLHQIRGMKPPVLWPKLGESA